MAVNELLRRWLRDNPVPWDSTNPLGVPAVEVASPDETPAGWALFQHTRDGSLAAVTPGTQYAYALCALRLPDDSGWAYSQVSLPTNTGG